MDKLSDKLTEKSDRARELRLKRFFTITVEEWERINTLQDGRCYVCRKVQKSGKRLALDHSHKTGLIRGLLCSQCNRLFGKIEREQWTVEMILRLAEYVNYPPAVLALGREIFCFAGRLGTKRHRKFLKKQAKQSSSKK